MREKSAHECATLRKRTAELEDQKAYLSSKLHDMNKELQSSRVYIDQLYAKTHSSHDGLSDKLKAELERRELEWNEKEQTLIRRIKYLEANLEGGQSKVSMEKYMLAVKEIHQFKLELLKEKKTVDELTSTVESLKDQIAHRRVSPAGHTGKTSAFLQYCLSAREVTPIHERNDENTVPEVVKHKEQATVGKTRNRAAQVKAAGGRKGLSEQLKQVRRFGEKSM